MYSNIQNYIKELNDMNKLNTRFVDCLIVRLNFFTTEGRNPLILLDGEREIIESKLRVGKIHAVKVIRQLMPQLSLPQAVEFLERHFKC